MIYTCYEMIRDCRTGSPEGWRYFVSSYVPVIRKLLAHYRAEPAALERLLVHLREPGCRLFELLEPSPERWFVAELRQKVLEQVAYPAPSVVLELETVAAALAPLTLVEKQTAWLETMRYSPEETGVLLRMSPETAQKIRTNAADLVRGKVDSWNRGILIDNGLALGRAAAAAKGKECLAPKIFLDMLDGRTSWRGREELEQHVSQCWHCVDHFCRLVEVVEVLRGNHPLTEAEAAPILELLGITPVKRPAWKRWLGGN
jgi:hypothetical protein